MTVILEMLLEGPAPSPGAAAPRVRGTQTSLTCVPGRGGAQRGSPRAGRGPRRGGPRRGGARRSSQRPGRGGARSTWQPQGRAPPVAILEAGTHGQLLLASSWSSRSRSVSTPNSLSRTFLLPRRPSLGPPGECQPGSDAGAGGRRDGMRAPTGAVLARWAGWPAGAAG